MKRKAMKSTARPESGRILVINGHPDKESYCAALAEAYREGAAYAGKDCGLVHLSDVHFDPVLHHGNRVIQELEPDLKSLQAQIKRARHLVLVYPVWWATFPALLKGLFDRAFLPGQMFKFREDKLLWERYMKGRSARCIVTMNTPPLLYRLFIKRPGDHAVNRGVLRFVGYRPVRFTHLGSVKRSDLKKRRHWLQKVRRLGVKGK